MKAKTFYIKNLAAGLDAVKVRADIFTAFKHSSQGATLSAIYMGEPVTTPGITVYYHGILSPSQEALLQSLEAPVPAPAC